MLELEQWNSALGSITRTRVRGVERIATKDALDALGVGPDPVTRQKVGKRRDDRAARPRLRFTPCDLELRGFSHGGAWLSQCRNRL